jgi:hypothetical protein
MQEAERNRPSRVESRNKNRKGNWKCVNLLYFQAVDPIQRLKTFETR